MRSLIQSRDWDEIIKELKDYFRPLDSDENIALEERMQRLSSNKPFIDKDIYDWLIDHRGAC